MRRLLGAIGVVALSVAACKGKMAKIDAVREALVADDAAALESATGDLPRCEGEAPVATAPGKPGPRDTGCLTAIANALGSQRGFAPSPPDHAAATTAAVVLARDGRGDYLVQVDNWLASLRVGKGPGLDALRLAVARKMAEGAPVVGRNIEDEASASAALKAIAAAIPGACPTYWLLGTGGGTGAGTHAIAPELSADHSACVQKDLSRREGAGASYGTGTFRALEGALAEWREAERALRLGLPNASPEVRAGIEKKLAIIEAATQKIETKKLDTTASKEALEKMGELHASAGVALWKMKDAGADGAAEAGALPADAAAPHR